MTKEEILDYCLNYPGVYEDHPFDGNWTVIRHLANKKIFAAIYCRDGRFCMNLKCEPGRADFLRSIFEDVKPGYHMNKTHWNTIILDGSLQNDEIYDMVRHSFELTKPKIKKERHLSEWE